MQYFWNNWELFCEGVLFEWVGAEGSEQRPGSPACDFFSLRSFLKTKLNIFPKPSLHWGGSNGAVKEEEEGGYTTGPPYSGIEVRDFNRCLSIFCNFSLKIIENKIFLYGNWARMRAGTSRIFFNIILVSKQPSKVQFWTSIFYNSSIQFQLLDLKPV